MAVVQTASAIAPSSFSLAPDTGPARTIHAPDLIVAQMLRTPCAVAVEFQGRNYSYAELDDASARIAASVRLLVDHAIEPLVGVCVERSFEMIAALVGVFRAGAAYLPLDPDLPAARLQDITLDARPDLLLCDAVGTDSFDAGDAPMLTIAEAMATMTLDTKPIVRSPPSADSLAYVIYTSGSTGRPKGVEIRQSNLANLLASLTNAPGFDERDVLLAATRMTFDMSVPDFFLPLSCGARIVLADTRTAADPRRLAALLATSGTTVFQATPTTWRALITAGWTGDPALRIWGGGEAMTRDLADRLLPRCRELWNLYGPTETTVWSTACRVLPSDGQSVPIGGPIDRTTIHILDDGLREVVDGELGELCLGGRGLAFGYRGRPDLTAERFPTLPTGERIYRTGDLARRDADGALHCAGRIDDQVKIRGHRVELGEIEAALGRHPAVAACVIRCLPDAIGESALFAYVDIADDTDTAILATFLRERLPAYMLPHRIVRVDAMPITPSGKIDRRALPNPMEAAVEARTERAAGDMLAAIWMELLGVDAVGDGDDFFALGGYSLLTVHLQCRIEERFGCSLSLSDLFAASTLGAMRARIASGGGTGEWRPLQLQPDGALPPLHWLDGGPLLRVVARQMNGERPVLGINLSLEEERTLGDRGEALRIENIAAALAGRIEALQPAGPLHVAGWCRWGIVAYEVTLQLRAAGRDVRKLVLLDAECPLSGWRRQADRLRTVLGLVRNGSSPPSIANFGAAVDRAGSHYRPRRLNGSVTLFMPQQAHADGRDVPHGGWGPLVADLRTIMTPGDHLTMVRPPHATSLAAAIDAALATC